MPTDLDQATGLERLEILSKIAGVDVFDMYVTNLIDQHQEFAS